MLAWRLFGKLIWDTHTHTHTHTHIVWILILLEVSENLDLHLIWNPLLRGWWCRRKMEILCVGFRGALELGQQRKLLLVSAWVQRRTGVITWLGMPVAEKMQLRKPGVFKWLKNKERSFSPKWREDELYQAQYWPESLGWFCWIRTREYLNLDYVRVKVLKLQAFYKLYVLSGSLIS